MYTFATPKLQPLINQPEGKSFILSCLSTEDTQLYDQFIQMDGEDLDDYAEEKVRAMLCRICFSCDLEAEIGS